MKILIIAVLFIVLVYCISRALRLPSQPPKKEEEMIQCEKCGTYVLKNEAIKYSGKYFCSKECL